MDWNNDQARFLFISCGELASTMSQYKSPFPLLPSGGSEPGPYLGTEKRNGKKASRADRQTDRHVYLEIQ